MTRREFWNAIGGVLGVSVFRGVSKGGIEDIAASRSCISGDYIDPWWTLGDQYHINPVHLPEEAATVTERYIAWRKERDRHIEETKGKI